MLKTMMQMYVKRSADAVKLYQKAFDEKLISEIKTMTEVCMDSDRYDENELGRYGKTGYMYNIHSPRNPDTGEIKSECFGALELYK